MKKMKMNAIEWLKEIEEYAERTDSKELIIPEDDISKLINKIEKLNVPSPRFIERQALCEDCIIGIYSFWDDTKLITASYYKQYDEQDRKYTSLFDYCPRCGKAIKQA